MQATGYNCALRLAALQGRQLSDNFRALALTSALCLHMQVVRPLMAPLVTPATVILNPVRALQEYAAGKQLHLEFVPQPPGPGSCVCSPPWGPWAAPTACSCCGMEARLGSEVIGR